MRSVIIVHDRANQRPWVAVDRRSGSELLRLQERYQLEHMCWRLGWDIVAQRLEGRTTTATDLKRAVRRLARG
jgi:hypothetical protein